MLFDISQVLKAIEVSIADMFLIKTAKMAVLYP